MIAWTLVQEESPGCSEAETPELVEINSIESELIDFFESIHNNSESNVPLRDGLLALEVAEEIMSQLWV